MWLKKPSPTACSWASFWTKILISLLQKWRLRSWTLVQGVEKSRSERKMPSAPKQPLSSFTFSASSKGSFNIISVQMFQVLFFYFLNPRLTVFITPSVNFTIYIKGYCLVNPSTPALVWHSFSSTPSTESVWLSYKAAIWCQNYQWSYLESHKNGFAIWWVSVCKYPKLCR